MHKFAIGLALCGGFLGSVIVSTQIQTTPEHDISCNEQSKTYIVQGDSMVPLLNPDDEITVAVGYYKCHEPQRAEVVVADYPHRAVPIVKKIYAVSGDSLEFIPVNGSEYHLLVNGEVILSDTGAPYQFELEKTKQIQAYINAYQGIIPDRYVLLLGTDPNGSLDSTTHGLFHSESLVGKVHISSI